MTEMPLTIAPGFRFSDPNRFDIAAYERYVDEKLPAEDPRIFCLHPNAEIGYLTNLGETLFFTILACSGGSGGGGGAKKEDIVGEMLTGFLERLPEPFNMIELNAKVKERSPYVVVCLQECEKMNILTETMRKSLVDLDDGFAGRLNITDDMETLANSMFLNKQPDLWVKYAYFSLKSLPAWFEDLLLRIDQLTAYAEELVAPKSLWISGLFNPMSYLTAIMQVTARRDGLPLDGMCLQTDVLNVEDPEQIPENAENGAYIHGFFLQGAAWEMGRGTDQGQLCDMKPKELTPQLPVVHVTAIETKDKRSAGYYECPVYVTSARGPTYVFTAGLRMESDEFDEKLWILAGVALLMAPE